MHVEMFFIYLRHLDIILLNLTGTQADQALSLSEILDWRGWKDGTPGKMDYSDLKSTSLSH